MSLSCSPSGSAFFAVASLALFGVGFVLFALLPAVRGDGEFSLIAFFDSSSFDFFFSCLARSSAFVSLVNAIVLPSGAQLGFAAPFGRSVKTNESPPVIGRIASCGGSGLPFFSVARRKRKNFPSGH